MSIGIVGLEANGFADLGDRLVQLSLRMKDDTEVIVGLGVSRLETDGFAELGVRVVELTLVQESNREIVVGGGEARLERSASRHSAIASSGFPLGAGRY